MRILGSVYLILAIGGIVGWIMNLVQIIHMIGDPLSNLFILKIAGIFVAPLGAVLGWVG